MAFFQMLMNVFFNWITVIQMPSVQMCLEVSTAVVILAIWEMELLATAVSFS